MHTNLFKIFCFSCQGKSRDIVYQCICLFLRLIFAQHALFEIQLTVYSALLRLTDLGIYGITRCGIWLLTIFHIPYIHFQREAKEKYRGVFEIQKSEDKTISGEIGLDIRTHASPKVGQDQVSGGVSVLCWHAAPVAYVLWKPCTIR